MHAGSGRIDLGRLALAPGQASALELVLGLDAVHQGAQSYEPRPAGTSTRVDVSRTSSGYAMRLRLTAELTGPCVRCLESAHARLEIDAREVEQPGTDDEELRSPYVVDGELDAGRWAKDAVVLALPARPLCRTDCAGLCPVCGESLNEADPEQHRHPSGGDPRMAKLRDLKLE